MKKVFLVLSIAFAVFTSCSEKDESTKPVVGETKETYIDATLKNTWHYYSLSDNKVVGSGEEAKSDNDKWFARTDWDFAVNRYKVRTNSGAATSVNAKGGVYTCSKETKFNDLVILPVNVQFVADKSTTSAGMGGDVTEILSTALVAAMKTGDDGATIMPPVYLQTPVYIFRTADGKNNYKVQFTQYQNENKVTGHIKFYSAQIQ